MIIWIIIVESNDEKTQLFIKFVSNDVKVARVLIMDNLLDLFNVEQFIEINFAIATFFI